MSNDLKGAVALVTGGGKGIGRAISLALAREGADLILVGRDQQALDETVTAIRAVGRLAYGLAADITKPEEVRKISEIITQEFRGRVDVIVTAAGRRDHHNKPVDELDIAGFNDVMDGNVNGTLLPIREVLPFMKARRHGKVIAISGVYGLKGNPKHAGGCASKWAVEGLVRVLALELGPYNINVNAVCPGYVEGPRSAEGMAKAAAARGIDARTLRAELEEATVLKRLSLPEDIANAVVFLATDKSRNITGQDLIVDAGWML